MCALPGGSCLFINVYSFSCNGSIEGYSVPDVTCPWFGSLSHPLPSSPPTPTSSLSLSSSLLLLMAAKDTQITVKLKTLKRYFHGLFGTCQPGIFYQKKYVWSRCCPRAGSTMTSHQMSQCLPSLKFANAQILSMFFVKPQMEHGVLIMTPAIYVEEI